MELEGYETSNGQTAISLLIENFPEAAEVVLDHSVHYSEHLNPSNPEYTVTYNFKHLDHDPDVKSSNGRFSAVKTMIKHKRDRLLLHPLTLKFNERKWLCLGRFVFTIDFATYLLQMILFTIFIVDARDIQDFIPFNETIDDISPHPGLRPGVKPSDIFKHDNSFVETIPPFILIFSFIHIIRDFLQIYVDRWSYFKHFTNYLDWTLYITTSIFMIPYVMAPEKVDELFEGTNAPRVVWIIGIVAIFVCYTNMMLFLRRYRLFGTYISMYVEVTQTVIQVLSVFVFLVLGFAVVFYILFQEQVRI